MAPLNSKKFHYKSNLINSSTTIPLLEINNLTIGFKQEDQITYAVEDISLHVNRGEIVAIVGESGSGKSVTALSILQLLPSPPAIYPSGVINFSPDGNYPINLLAKLPHEMQPIRGNQIAMIFQEPMSSLNPVFTCGDQVMEVIMLHKNISKKEAKHQTIELFAKVKLPDPHALFERYPHELSGGQKQRVMIAMAMSCKPDLLICDEPTTALDVTVQKTILQLIRELQQQENMGVIFITHDLGVVAEVADRAIVLYRGHIVEEGDVNTLFTQPQHPYTKSLLNCRPLLHQKGERLPVVSDFMDVNNAGIMTEKIKSTSRKNNEPILIRTHQPGDQKNPPDTLVSVNNLTVTYTRKKSLFSKATAPLRAVDDVSFDIYKGETLGPCR